MFIYQIASWVLEVFLWQHCDRAPITLPAFVITDRAECTIGRSSLHCSRDTCRYVSQFIASKCFENLRKSQASRRRRNRKREAPVRRICCGCPYDFFSSATGDTCGLAAHDSLDAHENLVPGADNCCSPVPHIGDVNICRHETDNSLDCNKCIHYIT